MVLSESTFILSGFIEEIELKNVSPQHLSVRVKRRCKNDILALRHQIRITFRTIWVWVLEHEKVQEPWNIFAVTSLIMVWFSIPLHHWNHIYFTQRWLLLHSHIVALALSKAIHHQCKNGREYEKGRAWQRARKCYGAPTTFKCKFKKMSFSVFGSCNLSDYFKSGPYFFFTNSGMNYVPVSIWKHIPTVHKISIYQYQLPLVLQMYKILATKKINKFNKFKMQF